MQITLTKEEAQKHFHTALCNGLSEFIYHGIVLKYNDDEYQISKDNWKKNNNNSSPCYEDVLIQMLVDGYSLTFDDVEGDGNETKVITIKDVHEKVQNTPIEHLSAMINEEDDAWTADAVLQTVVYGELLFG